MVSGTSEIWGNEPPSGRDKKTINVGTETTHAVCKNDKPPPCGLGPAGRAKTPVYTTEFKMQTDYQHHQDSDVVEILEAPSHIRKRLSYACIVIILLSITAWPLALWYQNDVECQKGARLWCACNVFTAIFISWLAPFKATLRRTCSQRAAFLTGVFATTAQVALGCYLISVAKDIHCMMESVNGAFMFALLVLEASLLGSVLGLSYSGYRLH